MSEDALRAELRRLGLGEPEATVYLAALTAGPCALQELAARLDRSPAEVRAAADRLIDLGLAASTGERRSGLAPLEPTWALERLLTARVAELQDARLAAARAYRDFRRAAGEPPPSAEDLLEVVTGAHVAERLQHVEATVESEVLRFDSPPYHMGAGPNPAELDNLAQGVVYRAVYSKTAVQDPEYYACNIRPCVSAGEQAKVAPTVPVKLTVFDRKLAIVSVPFDDGRLNDSLLVVRPSILLSALTELFEHSWHSAFPLHLGDRVPSALRPVQRRILELLGTGLTDEAIAELLGISRRTLSRHLSELTTQAGAVNRFQLALHAARTGWVQ